MSDFVSRKVLDKESLINRINFIKYSGVSHETHYGLNLIKKEIESGKFDIPSTIESLRTELEGEQNLVEQLTNGSRIEMLENLVEDQGKEIERLTDRIFQHRKALGYEISYQVKCDPDIENKIAESLQTELKSVQKSNEYLEQRMKDNHSQAVTNVMLYEESQELVQSQKEEIVTLQEKLKSRNILLAAMVDHIDTVNTHLEDQKERIENQSALIDHQAKQVESLQEKVQEFEERYTDSQFHVKALSDVESVQLQQLESLQKELTRIKEQIKPLYDSNDNGTHLIACRVLRDPDRYPPKVGVGNRFS